MVIGVDIGGTKIAAGRVSGNRIVAGFKVPTMPGQGKAALIRRIVKIVESAWAPGVSGIGVGIAGLVNHEKGVFLDGPNLPKSFKNVPLAAILKRKFGVPVKIDNDAHCFTLAEARVGAAKGHRNVVGLAFGTGVGGGMMIDGRLYRGRNNGAGEYGHSMISLGSATKCGCGQAGHFEAFASGSAMSHLYASFGGSKVSAIEVEQRAKKGDSRAKKVLRVMAEALTSGLAGVVMTINPDIIVVGGGLSKVDILWKPALKNFRSKVIFQALRSTPVVRSKLGTDANIIGAALLLNES